MGTVIIVVGQSGTVLRIPARPGWQGPRDIIEVAYACWPKDWFGETGVKIRLEGGVVAACLMHSLESADVVTGGASSWSLRVTGGRRA